MKISLVTVVGLDMPHDNTFLPFLRFNWPKIRPYMSRYGLHSPCSLNHNYNESFSLVTDVHRFFSLNRTPMRAVTEWIFYYAIVF